MGRGTRTALQRQMDLSTVVKLKLQGKTFLQIAHSINETSPRIRPYTEAMAKKDWSDAFAAIKAEQADNVKDAKAMEIAWRDNLEGVMWQEFNASKGTQETRNTEIITVEVPVKDPLTGEVAGTTQIGSTRKRSTMTQKQMLADSKWIFAMLQNRDARAKLTGVNDPEIIQLNHDFAPDGILAERQLTLEKLERARIIFEELEAGSHPGIAAGSTNGAAPNTDW